MADYTEAELAELRSIIRAEVQDEMTASQRSQSGLARFLNAIGMHMLARTVLNLSTSAWKSFRRLIGWS